MIAVGLCGCTPTETDMPPTSKTINYNDGMMTFRVPHHWREDREPEGSDFYDPSDEHRTLRLTVMNFRAPSPQPVDYGQTTLDGLTEKYGGQVDALGNAYYFTTHDRVSEEDGEPLAHRKWLLSRMITDTESHLAIFTYTYPDSLRTDPRTLVDLGFLEEAVRAAKFYDIENPSGAEQDAGGQAPAAVD